jgi:hypothetical protein
VYDRMMKSSLLGPLPQETVTRFEKTKEKIALGLRVVADQQANDLERPDVRVPLILERTLTLLKKSGLTLDSTSLPDGTKQAIVQGLNSPGVSLAKKQKVITKLAECARLLETPRIAPAYFPHGEGFIELGKMGALFSGVAKACQKDLDHQHFKNLVDESTPEMLALMRRPQERFSLLYVEKVLDARNAHLCPSTFENGFYDEIKERAFQESSLNSEESSLLMSKQDLLSGKHPFIGCLPTFEQGELNRHECQEKFAELLRLAMTAQKQHGLGVMGIWVEWEGACLVVSISSQGTFGIVAQDFNSWAPSSWSCNRVEEVVQSLSSGSAQVIKNLKWTPLYNKTPQPAAAATPVQTAPVAKQQAAPAKPTFGEVRFKFTLPKGSKSLVVRGDNEAGLGNWKQSFPVQFDQSTGEWVFPLRSNKGLFKFVLDDQKWETGPNRSCSGNNRTPPKF